MKQLIFFFSLVFISLSQNGFNYYFISGNNLAMHDEISLYEKVELVRKANLGGKNFSSLKDIIDLYVTLKFLAEEKIPERFQELIRSVHLIEYFNQSQIKVSKVGNYYISHSAFGEGITELGDIAIVYDHLKRIEQIGSFQISYSPFDNRIEKIGDLEIQYDVSYNRIVRIGSTSIDYEVNSNRISSIAYKDIKYDSFIDRVESIDGMNILYNDSYKARIWSTGSKDLSSNRAIDENLAEIKRDLQDTKQKLEDEKQHFYSLFDDHQIVKNKLKSARQKIKELKEKLRKK